MYLIKQCTNIQYSNTAVKIQVINCIVRENWISIIVIARYNVILIFSNSLWRDPVTVSLKQIYNFFRKSWWDDSQNLIRIMIKASKNWSRQSGVYLNYFLLSNKYNDTDLVFLVKGSLSFIINTFSFNSNKKFNFFVCPMFKIRGSI